MEGVEKMSEKLVIIGGVAAGTSAAAKARRVNPNLDITLYTDDKYISYAGCGLPYFIGGRINSREKLLARSIADFTAQNIRVRNFMRAEEINPENGKVIIRDLQNELTREDNYDRLIIATGARPLVPSLEGIELDGVFTLRTIHDSLRIKDFLFRHQPQKVAVIAGYIGLEMENLVEHGCQVT